MSPAKCPHKETGEVPRPTTKIQINDMDTVQEEGGNDSDSSSHGDVENLRERTRAMLSVSGAEPLMPHSQPSSRRMSSDIDVKNLNTRRPSAIIAAFRRPSQALALCAATQRKFLDQVLPRSSRASMVSAHHDHAFTATEIIGHEALSKALSALYAKLLVLLGLAFPVTEVIATGVHDGYYQGFYLYLYTVSVLFVVFQYATIVRQKAVSDIIHTYGEHGDHEKSTEKTQKVAKENYSRYGSFYLRLGAIAFGIGSMVYNGLEFGEYFEMSSGACASVLAALTPAVRMALTLLQMQFIFLNSKEIETCSHKLLQRFGFMHMIATNLCEWLYVIVEETKHEIHHLEHVEITHGPSLKENLNMTSQNSTHGCRRANMMGALLQNASPFLFPCTIEYSLICAVILYEMWKEVKCTPEDFEKKLNPHQNKSSRQNSVTPEKILQQFAGMLGVSSPGGAGAAHHFSVDCSHAHRGLFSGILLIVLTIISLIMFFVLAGNPNTVTSGIFEVNICELILYALSMIAVLVAFLHMRQLTYKRKSGAVLGLDTSLLMLAQSGMFIYCMFSMIGSFHTYNKDVGSGLTGFFSELMGLLQTILQTLFIVDAWWRRCTSRQQRQTKPGRQLVTFLLVGNMAMWAVNTLEKNRAEFRPAHLDFYGKWAWTIITHVSMPLAIFYRFHSTICLFEIWKNSFKSKPIYINV